MVKGQPVLPFDSNRGQDCSKLAIILIDSAMIIVLKANDNIPCSKASRRMTPDVICTSDTWLVMPMINEK